MIPLTWVALKYFKNNTMIELSIFIAVGLIMAAGFIYLEYKFAKMNETETRGNLSAIEVVLKKIGAEKVEYDPAG